MSGRKKFFSCSTCGSKELFVVHNYIKTTCFTDTLFCRCKYSEGDIAARKRFHITKAYSESGPLKDNHHWNSEGSREVERIERATDEKEVYCEECFEMARKKDWKTVDNGNEMNEDSHDYFVHCGGCNREIEFGWSKPNGTGSIWPVECTDFNPSKAWPDTKYMDIWEEFTRSVKSN